jgi:hypothetical protein
VSGKFIGAQNQIRGTVHMLTAFHAQLTHTILLDLSLANLVPQPLHNLISSSHLTTFFYINFLLEAID